MKFILIPLIFVSMIVIGQNRDSLCYDLINHKLQQDKLQDSKLSTCIAAFDTLDLEILITLLKDSTSDINIINDLKALNSKSQKEAFYKVNDVLAQLESSKGNWDIKKLTKKQNVYRCKRLKKSIQNASFSLSIPLFMNDNKNALLLVESQFGGGTIEIYQQLDKGGWYKVDSILIWLGE